MPTMRTNILQAWFNDALTRTLVTIMKSGLITGSYRRNYAPIQWARVVMYVAPANELTVEVDHINQLASEPMLDSALYGVLDILLTAQGNPTLSVLLRLEAVHIDKFSTENAMRMAGRDIGRQIIEKLA